MGSGDLAVDAMAIGCLGVDRRVELFFSYLAIFDGKRCFCKSSASAADPAAFGGVEGSLLDYVQTNLHLV